MVTILLDVSRKPTMTHPATHSAADPSATTGGEPDPTAVVPPVSGERYRIGEEIARGGMGVVHRATDAALGREVAVKVLLDRFAPDSTTARRFWDEARITGQLQHPNIPAVYDVGTLPGGRPFLAMKLIKGETLDDLLKRRPDPSADRGRWLGVFEKVCEAVAYAHAHDVIHRDFKPQNVMVGAFGEVQVMDWGLAKVLTLSRPTESGADPAATAPETAIVSQRESDNLHMQAGSVLGTPAYMPPEQAIGAIDQIDRRSDVFGLGGILSCILTGQPPFVGPTAESTRQMAANRKLGDCFARLHGSGAEPDLIALAKRCLAGEQADRPADAKAVAAAVHALRVAADERARRAEVDAAEGRVRLAEGRKRRRVAAALGGVVLAAVTAGGAAAGVQWRRAVAQEAATAAALAEKTAEERAKGEALDRLQASQQQTLAALRKATDEVVRTNLERRPEVTEQERGFLRELLALWRAVADARGDTAEARELRAEGAYRVGGVLYDLGEATDAEAAYRAALGTYDKLAAEFPARPDYRQGLARTQNNLGLLLTAADRAADAEAAIRAALGIREKLAAEFPARLDYRVGLGNSCCNFGLLMRDTGRPGDSLDWYAKAIAALAPVYAADPRQVTPKVFLRDSHWGRAVALDRLGRHDDALADWDRAIELSTPRERVRVEVQRATSLLQAGQTDRAMSEVDALLALPQKWPAGQIYGFACVYAVASGKLPAKRDEMAGRAMDLLRKAVANGWKNAAHMWRDADLDPLRSRPDFQQLLADLGAAREPAPPPRNAR